MADELFDLLTEAGEPTGQRKERKRVHRDGKPAGAIRSQRLSA